MGKIFVAQKSNHMVLLNQRYSMSAKVNGTQIRTPVSQWRMHCMYCSTPKCISQGEAMSISEYNQACSFIYVLSSYTCLNNCLVIQSMGVHTRHHLYLLVLLWSQKYFSYSSLCCVTGWIYEMHQKVLIVSYHREYISFNYKVPLV